MVMSEFPLRMRDVVLPFSSVMGEYFCVCDTVYVRFGLKFAWWCHPLFELSSINFY